MTPRIELLIEENFGLWFVNIRAELRLKKLWKYIQEVYESEDSTPNINTNTITEQAEESPQISKKE